MRILIAVLAVAVVAWVPGKLSADEPTTVLVERIQDLKLSDEQESKIADIQKECGPKVQEAAKELGTIVREEVTKIQAILTPEQKEKLKAHREERKEFRAERLAEHVAHLQELDLTDAEVAKIAEIRATYHPKIVKAMENLRGILTEQQRTAREEGLKAGKKRKEIFASLNLTDEQKEKVEAVAKEVAGLVREQMEKVGDVLTEGQKEKLQEFKEERKERVRDRHAHMVANFKDLNLTDEQKEKITEIRKEYRPKVHEAGNMLRAAVRDEVEKVLNVLKG
jgi:Spy/CpxP family protein refolding chaperone